MKKSQNKKGGSTTTLREVIKFLAPYKFLTLLSVILSAGCVFFTLYVPILVGNAIDCIVEKGNVDFSALLPILCRAGICVGITAVLQWIVSTINNNITFETIRDVRKAAFEKLQILPLSYLDTHPSGDIVSRMIADVDTFADGLLLGFTQLFTGALTILGTLFFMFYLSPVIAAVVVVITPLSLFMVRFVSKRTYSMFKKQSEVRGEQTTIIDEAITGAKIVKAFAHEDEMLADFDENNDRLSKCSLSATFFSSLVKHGT